MSVLGALRAMVFNGRCQFSYGTALSCSSTYLYYPATESEFEGSVFVKNSQITIEIKRLDIEDKRCVDLAEESANELLRQYSFRNRRTA